MQARYPYYGLGFLVNILNVPMMEIDGEWVPDIDFNRVENDMAYAVPLKPVELTGAEVHFLRRHLGWTMDELAGKLGVTRQCIVKWEKTRDSSTKMDFANEKLFRMLVLNALGVKPAMFQKAFDALYRKEKASTKTYELDMRRSSSKRSGNHILATLLA